MLGRWRGWWGLLMLGEVSVYEWCAPGIREVQGGGFVREVHVCQRNGCIGWWMCQGDGCVKEVDVSGRWVCQMVGVSRRPMCQRGRCVWLRMCHDGMCVGWWVCQGGGKYGKCASGKWQAATSTTVCGCVGVGWGEGCHHYGMELV